jgi:hypothetical protein
MLVRSNNNKYVILFVQLPRKGILKKNFFLKKRKLDDVIYNLFFSSREIFKYMKHLIDL